MILSCDTITRRLVGYKPVNTPQAAEGSLEYNELVRNHIHSGPRASS